MCDHNYSAAPMGPPSLWFERFASQALGRWFDFGLWLAGGLSWYRSVLSDTLEVIFLPV